MAAQLWAKRKHGRYFTSHGALLWHSIRPDERLAETNNEPGEPRQVPRKLGSTDADGKGQLGSPTAANDEKTQNVTGYKRRARLPMPAVQHNADKEKEKAVEASLWTRVSSPCPKWRRRRLLLPSHVQAPARPVAQHQNFGEKEKASVLALLRHIHLPYSVASDEKLLETSHGLGTGGPAASRHRAATDRTGGGSMERNFWLSKRTK